MTSKLQQGGILALILQLPEDQLKKIMQAFAQWAQQKGVNLKQLQQNPQALEQALGQFMQEMQQQTRSARHGAKLNYIKSLKHQCAEDEEVVYYKKGGSVDCGCKKKTVEKDCGGSKMKLFKKGDKVCPKCGKVHAAGNGCIIDKFKRR